MKRDVLRSPVDRYHIPAPCGFVAHRFLFVLHTVITAIMRFAIWKEKNEKDPSHLRKLTAVKAECYQGRIQSLN